MSALDLVVASQNRHKIGEIKELLVDLPIRIISLQELGSYPGAVEDGLTFRQNAAKKALPIAKFTGKPTLADDSGLEVDALGGAPGIHSARFAGEPSNDGRNNAKLLEKLEGLQLKQRGAQFRCVMALAFPHGEIEYTEGICRGFIAFEPRGRKGFGYDPLFLVPRYGRTFAELEPEEKNKISHRFLAMQKMKEVLKIKAGDYY